MNRLIAEKSCAMASSCRPLSSLKWRHCAQIARVMASSTAGPRGVGEAAAVNREGKREMMMRGGHD